MLSRLHTIRPMHSCRQWQMEATCVWRQKHPHKSFNVFIIMLLATSISYHDHGKRSFLYTVGDSKHHIPEASLTILLAILKHSLRSPYHACLRERERERERERARASAHVCVCVCVREREREREREGESVCVLSVCLVCLVCSVCVCVCVCV